MQNHRFNELVSEDSRRSSMEALLKVRVLTALVGMEDAGDVIRIL